MLQKKIIRYPLNKENTSSTNSELWGLGFAEGSFSFVLSATGSAVRYVVQGQFVRKPITALKVSNEHTVWFLSLKPFLKEITIYLKRVTKLW